MNGSTGKFQPWVGLRGAIYPVPRLRLELSALVQGLGTNGGIWGWGSQLVATWAVNKWLNAYLGFRALSSGNSTGEDRKISSIRFTEYGPLLGVGFTF